MRKSVRSLVVRFLIGVLLVLAGIPWYPHPAAIAISVIGGLVLATVRARTYQQPKSDKGVLPPTE